MRFVRFCLTAAALFGSTALVLAQGPAANPSSPTAAPSAPAGAPNSSATEPDVATLLFSRPQWAKAPTGTALTYTYAKKTADPAFGPSFEDHITIALGPGHDGDSRTVDAQMFSGANAKPTGQFDSAQNPVLLLVFEENVQELARIFGTNARYLKNRVREAWREHPEIAPAQIDFQGRKVAGTRITVQPFVGNAEAGKMRGLDGMVYTVEIADDIPGTIASIDIHAPSDGAPKFSETLRFSSMKAP